MHNLNGLFFDVDGFEHAACVFVADWSETGKMEIRICDLEELKKCEIFQ